MWFIHINIFHKTMLMAQKHIRATKRKHFSCLVTLDLAAQITWGGKGGSWEGICQKGHCGCSAPWPHKALVDWEEPELFPSPWRPLLHGEEVSWMENSSCSNSSLPKVHGSNSNITAASPNLCWGFQEGQWDKKLWGKTLWKPNDL